MEIGAFVDLVFDMIHKISVTLTSFSFRVFDVPVNPFGLSVAMIIVYMVVYSYWRGSRA